MNIRRRAYLALLAAAALVPQAAATQCYPSKNVQYIIPYDRNAAFVKERAKEYLDVAKHMSLVKQAAA